MRWWSLGLLWGLAGCAAHANRSADVDLQRAFDVTAQRAALAEAAVAELTERLDVISGQLQRQGLMDASEGASLDELQREMGSIRGQLEEMQFALQTLQGDLEAMVESTDRRAAATDARLAQIESMLGVTPPSVFSVPEPEISPDEGEGETAQPEPAEDPAPVDLPGRLALGRERLDAGQAVAAQAILDSVVEQMKAEGHPGIDEAIYFQGEALRAQSKWKEAARVFRMITEEYPSSSWSSWAMLRIGDCFEGMGRSEAAQTFYDGVIRNYPASEAATEAKTR